MTQEIIQMARDSGMELYGLGKDRARFVYHLEAFAKLVAEKATAKERLAQPEQEPVVGTRTWFEDGKVVTKYLHPSDIYIDPPQRIEEPTKEMIDAAERIDWADSDVRGNIVNMWQAMSAVAPTPPQRTWVGLNEEDYVLVNQLCINPIQAAEFVDRLLKERNQ
jgi:hypothetical protein